MSRGQAGPGGRGSRQCTTLYQIQNHPSLLRKYTPNQLLTFNMGLRLSAITDPRPVPSIPRPRTSVDPPHLTGHPGAGGPKGLETAVESTVELATIPREGQ